MKRYILYLVLLIVTISIKGQVGKEFWFAAPNVWEGYGDEPLAFRITTFDKEATVTVSLPADNNRILYKKIVEANSHLGLEVNKSDVENFPSNQVNNKGILITSTADISAYYDVSSPKNPEKFVLKGNNALGHEFFIPSQTIYGNNSQFGSNANEKADIVAVEDNTTITILPTTDVVGHKANIPFVITLNRGQTYCIECTSTIAGAALAGTQIESDKLIAVTISDDAVMEDESSYPCDLIGDQLIPVTALGYEYIAINTSKAPNSKDNNKTVQKVFVLAIEDNTLVFLNNTTKTVQALNKGETAVFDISDHAVFIYATKRVYAYQVTGLVNASTTASNELASAILPGYSCNGSRKLSFTRIFNKDFWVNMVVKRKHIKDFLMYDNAGNHIDINKYMKSWQTVPGQETGQDAWVSSAVNMNDLSTGLPYSIENTSGLFHLCVLDEADSKVKDGGASFAYFSSYNSFALMGPEETCMGSQVSLQASVGLMNYKWFSSHTGNQVLSNTNTLLVEESGNYWVEAEVQFGGCKVVDSLNVNFLFPEIELGSDTTVCEGDALTYSVDDSFSSYLWNNGDTDHETNWQMDMNGQFLIDVTVTDNMGCVNSDTVRVQVNDTPDIVLNTNEVCKGGVVSNTTSFEHYEWVFNGAVLNVDKTQNWIEPTQSGVYSLTAWTNNGCQVTEDIVLTVNPLPSFVLNDQFACDGETFTVDAPLGFALYNWSTGESTQSIVLNADTDYWLELTDTNGCVAREEASLRYRQPVLLDLGPDQNECVGASIRLTNSADYTNFSWTFKPESDPAVSVPLNPVPANEYYLASGIQANSGTYIVEATDVNGCNVQDEIRIFFSDTDPINLRITENLCAGQTIDIIATEGYDSYTWYENNVHVPAYDNMVQISGVNTDALFRVEATSVVCVKSSEIEVVEHLLPTVNLPDVFSICDGEEEELFVDNFNSPTGASFSYLYWNDVDSVRYSDWNSARVLVNGAGNYNVTAVDEFGCMAMDNVTVSAFAISVFDLGPPISACDNENVLLTNPIVGAQSYNWYQTTPTGENLLVSDNALSVNQSGTFVLKVVDANGCNSNDQVTVNVNSAPDFSLGPDQVECGQIDLAIDPQADFAQYQWNDNPALNSNQLHVTKTGLYKLEVWNTFGCRSEDVVDITLVEAPEIMLSDTAVCAGEEVQLVGPSGSYSYLWNTGEDTQAILAKNGHYELKVTDPNGCFATSEVNVVWRSVPQVNLGPDVIVCPIDEWFLDAGAGFTSYSWHNGSEEQGVIANLMDTVNIVHVTDQFGCTGFDSQTVKHKVAEPLELISDTSICNSDVLIASVDPSFVMYEWSTGHIQPDIEIRQEGQYWLKAFDGCVWAADTMQVVVHPTPVIAHLDTSIYAQVVVLPEGGTAPYSYAVNGNDYQESNLFANLSNGKYVFEVEDVNGCLAMNEMALDNVLDIDISPILTPNGDGYNDTWGIKGIDKMPNSIIRIFDRYGKQLAEYKASEPAWDGMYLGRPVPSDAYWYIIQLMPLNRTLKGYITIKR